MSPSTLGAVAAFFALFGGYLLVSSAWSDRIGLPRNRPLGASNSTVRRWLAEAGLNGVRPREVGAVMGVLCLFGGLACYALFGGLLPAVVGGLSCAATPISSYRSRRAARRDAAREAWPRLLEELRVSIGSLGRSVPQALFEAGRRAPEEWRPAFAAAEREWLLTTDFARTTLILKHLLSDSTADVVCETLVVANELGGTDVDGRLADLIHDRFLDLQGRKDAASRQAGVRFARRFVLLVPLGMAVVGLSIGTGRSAYASPGGQVAVAAGLLAVVGCWIWSGRLMRLPEEPRVFG